jgi:N-acetylneuraminic acid mutarotase
MSAISGSIHIGNGPGKNQRTITLNKVPRTEVGNAWETLTPMPEVRYTTEAVIVGDYLYVIGGLSSNSEASTNTNNWRYHIPTDTWAIMQPLPAPRANGRCVSDNTYIYYISGQSSSSTYVTTVYRYTISTNTWTTMDSIPAAKTYFGCAINNNKIYCVAGYAGSYTNTHYCYDISNDSWSTLTEYPFSGYKMSGAGLNSDSYNRIWMTCGYNTSANVSTCYYYSIPSDIWSSWSAGYNLLGHGAVICKDLRVYLVGGVADTSSKTNNAIIHTNLRLIAAGSAPGIIHSVMPDGRIYAGIASTTNYIFVAGGAIKIYSGAPSDTLFKYNFDSKGDVLKLIGPAKIITNKPVSWNGIKKPADIQFTTTGLGTLTFLQDNTSGTIIETIEPNIIIN